MMTEEQYRLTQLKEELIEVAMACLSAAQACSKAIRFGLDDTWAERSATNADQITKELNEVDAALIVLNARGLHHDPNWKIIGEESDELVDAKIAKMEKWLGYAREKGKVQ